MQKNYSFIDLFCGIGGFRLALESLGAQCVFSAEINSHACQMYEANFGDNPYCDITQLDPDIIPDFDILCAGFPCQAFSKAGKQKGFDDARGTLFFDICRIVEEKKPKILLLENVKNLKSHDNGNTFKVIQEAIHNLGYQLSYQILSARHFGVPQHRERIILVAIRNDLACHFDFSHIQLSSVNSMANFLDSGKQNYLNSTEYTLLDMKNVKTQSSGLIFCGYRNKKMRINGVLPGTSHLSRSHKQFNRIYHINGIHPTLSSQEASGRYFIYDEVGVRKLTLAECYRFMGFPEAFIKTGSQANLYARIGNSVCIPMIKAVYFEIIRQINQNIPIK